MLLRPANRATSHVRSSIRQTPRTIRMLLARPCQARYFSTPKIGLRSPVATYSTIRVRAFHTTPVPQIDILPDADKPAGQTKESEPHYDITAATPITDELYHSQADGYMESLLVKLQQMEEKGDLVDVEYSAGVLRIETKTADVYVLNKQPPNKQIWLSSPISGPKRYDWVVLGESMHQKEGSGSGDWIYLRDGTSLGRVLRKELGVELDDPLDMPEGAR